MVRTDELTLEFIWKDKGTRIDKTVLKKKNKVEGITVSDLKAHYVATVIVTVWYYMRRHTDPWNRIETPEVDIH